MDVDPVADGAGHAQHPRVDGGDVHRWIRNVDGPGGPLPVQERELDESSVVVKRDIATEGTEARSDRLDVIAQSGAWMFELRAVTALHVSTHLGAETKPEPAGRRLRQLPRHLGRDHRRPGKADGDTGEDVEARSGEGRRRAPQGGGAAAPPG